MTAEAVSDEAAMALGAWRLPEHLQRLQDLVRRFMATEVRPLGDTLPHAAAGPLSTR